MSDKPLRGGDHWYYARSQSLAFRTATLVHRLKIVTSYQVAEALGISTTLAYAALDACVKRHRLYNVRRIKNGRFTTVPLRRKSLEF